MRRSLFPDDDALPTWLHTFALFFVVSLFGVPLVWIGGEAIFSRHLEPLSGPTFGEFFFDNTTTLQGNEAVWAGFSLVTFGCCFFALAVSLMRSAQGNRALRVLPWVFLAVSIALSLQVGRHG